MDNQHAWVKNEEQNKALVHLLEYLFLIEDLELEKKYNDFRKSVGGAFKMTIDEIRKMHYTQKGKEEGREEGEMKKAIETAKEMILDREENEKIKRYTKLEDKIIDDLRKDLARK